MGKTRKYSLFLAFSLLIGYPAWSQDLSWLQTGAKVGGQGQISDVKVDSRGYIVLTGFADFFGNPNWANEYFSFSDTAIQALEATQGVHYFIPFIAKLDKTGRLVWLKSITGTDPRKNGGGEFRHIEIDEFDNIYFSGWIDDHMMIENYPNAKPDVPGFITKMTPHGEIQWMQKLVKYPGWNTWQHSIDEFRVDRKGFIYAAGVLADHAIQVGNYTRIWKTNEFYILKFDSLGVLVATYFDSAVSKYSSFITTGPDGKIYCAYQVNSYFFKLISGFTIDLLPIRTTVFSNSKTWLSVANLAIGANEDIYLAGHGSDSICVNGERSVSLPPAGAAFLLKLTNGLKPVWIKPSGPTLIGGPYHLLLSKHDVYLSGPFYQNLDFGEHSAHQDADAWFLAQFSQSSGVNKSISLTVPWKSTKGYQTYFVDACDNLYWGSRVQDSMSWGQVHLDFTSGQSSGSGVFLAKFSWDTVRYVDVSTGCGIVSLNNTSLLSGVKFQWVSDGKILDTSYHLTYSFPQSGRYAVSLVALKQDGCSSTFTDTIDYIKPQIDLSAKINCVTTVADGLEIRFESHPSAAFYCLFRENPNGSWQLVARTKLTSIEDKVKPGEVNRYKMAIEDSCQNLHEYSEIVSNMILKGKAQDAEWANLQWNRSEDQTTSWEVQRKGSDNVFKTIATVNQTAYADFNFYEAGGSASCYRIIDRSSVCEASSQELCFPYPVRIYLPNCFTPNSDSLNQVYKPVATNIVSYELIVYNRWGERVFETTQLEKGWDGTIGGNPAAEGLYRYILKARGIDYSIISRSEYFSLLR